MVGSDIVDSQAETGGLHKGKPLAHLALSLYSHWEVPGATDIVSLTEE